ncbi:imidazolonepropionase-like amidohydrolase [Keratinibaculum paraultunense]|uniref:Imidazolonepropionase-like amidohydrolase n=1 Tax=Keratinibaculum paraultunense TaxID=1278232 RepID=A0A4R3L4G0_9FIRM|nr:amidohydrolase [Keratinibaculum paraultunense]QQY80090.1 amidohydrolase [Keratinibaculum paraultunense]TCS91589.1 imidazolonepropionase-like amidohydrolase [Keratinibaculum paraultunense]
MIFIKNGRIFTMTGEVIENGSVLIDNGKIAEVGEDLVAPLDAEVIDADGKMVLPGFIDAHCHIGMWEEGMGFEGDDGNEWVDPVTPHLRAIDAINPMDEAFKEAYTGGVTTAVTGPGSANVIGGMFVAIKTCGKRVDDMILKEPVAMKIAFGENPKRVYESQKKSPITRMATAAVLRETLYKAKVYQEKKEKAKDDPSKMPEFDMKMEALLKVLNKEIPLKAHAHRADDIFTALRIAKEFDLDITLDHCTEGHLIADYLKDEGRGAIVGPTLSNRSKVELRNLTFDTPRILHEAGVKIAIMTDSPVIPLHYLPICAGLAVKSGLDEMEALKAITINPAEIVGIDDRVGSIEVGKDADIVIFDGNPIKDIDCKTYTTIIDGEIVYKMDK